MSTRFVYGRPVSVGYTRGVDAGWPFTLNDYHRAHVSGIVVTASEVQARKVALDAGWSQLALDITLSALPALLPTAPDGAAFDADFASWKIFLQDTTSSLNAGTQDDTTSLWQTKLVAWQSKAKSLGVATHGVPVPLPPAPWNPTSLAWPVALGLGAVAAAMIFRK
jgi:hypothetical protein